jgi:peptidoglycan DL-endopeptidase CwlO
MRTFFAVCLLWCLGLLAGRAENTPINDVHRSLNGIGNSIKNTFAEDSDDRPSPTPRRHRKSSIKKSPSKKPADEPVSESSKEAKQDPQRTTDGGEKPDSSPSPTPGSDEGPGSDTKNKSEPAAPMATIKPEQLREFSEQPAEVQQLIRSSLALTEQNLGYKYGSADPASGGMDCSGFIYYVLSGAGFKDVPRDSSGQYEWVRKNSDFHAVLSRSGDSFELKDLKPGDLMFWSGTYKVDRDIPITHVMIYLGKEKSSGKPVMVGATDGRSYDGVPRYGVSVFDFKMPSGKPNKDDPGLTAKFEGYAGIPGLRPVDVESKNQEKPEEGVKEDKVTPDAKRKSTTDGLGDGD